MYYLQFSSIRFLAYRHAEIRIHCDEFIGIVVIEGVEDVDLLRKCHLHVLRFIVSNISANLSGAGSGLVPMYLTEIAPVNIRGAMGVLQQLALTIGICVSQLLGLRQLLGSATLWPILLAASAVPFILSCVVLPFYPDSPRWLLVKRGNEHAATKGKSYNSEHLYTLLCVCLHAVVL